MIGRHRLDYSQIRVEDVPKLSKHHQRQYEVWKVSQDKRKKASTDFLRCFTESCNVYSDADKIEQVGNNLTK